MFAIKLKIQVLSIIVASVGHMTGLNPNYQGTSREGTKANVGSPVWQCTTVILVHGETGRRDREF